MCKSVTQSVYLSHCMCMCNHKPFPGHRHCSGLNPPAGRAAAAAAIQTAPPATLHQTAATRPARCRPLRMKTAAAVTVRTLPALPLPHPPLPPALTQTPPVAAVLIRVLRRKGKRRNKELSCVYLQCLILL